MPFIVMHPWAKWDAGAEITGGDIAEYCGQESMPETDRIKLGLPKPSKGISEERIKELIGRGILKGIGDDACMQPDQPLILQPTFEERQALSKQFNVLAQDGAGYNRQQDLNRAQRARGNT